MYFLCKIFVSFLCFKDALMQFVNRIITHTHTQKKTALYFFIVFNRRNCDLNILYFFLFCFVKIYIILKEKTLNLLPVKIDKRSPKPRDYCKNKNIDFSFSSTKMVVALRKKRWETFWKKKDMLYRNKNDDWNVTEKYFYLPW